VKRRYRKLASPHVPQPGEKTIPGDNSPSQQRWFRGEVPGRQSPRSGAADSVLRRASSFRQYEFLLRDLAAGQTVTVWPATSTRWQRLSWRARSARRSTRSWDLRVAITCGTDGSDHGTQEAERVAVWRPAAMTPLAGASRLPGTDRVGGKRTQFSGGRHSIHWAERKRYSVRRIRQASTVNVFADSA
jgi:hypothetical protein